jgi:hypothetical protein
MDRYVARLNIEHFREQLAKEQDPARREKLRRMLAEEGAKLAALAKPPGGKEAKG